MLLAQRGFIVLAVLKTARQSGNQAIGQGLPHHPAPPEAPLVLRLSKDEVLLRSLLGTPA